MCADSGLLMLLPLKLGHAGICVCCLQRARPRNLIISGQHVVPIARVYSLVAFEQLHTLALITFQRLLELRSWQCTILRHTQCSGWKHHSLAEENIVFLSVSRKSNG